MRLSIPQEQGRTYRVVLEAAFKEYSYYDNGHTAIDDLQLTTGSCSSQNFGEWSDMADGTTPLLKGFFPHLI